MNIDPNTNLPAIPEGYFWRVGNAGVSYLRLELRRKRFLGSVEIYNESVWTCGWVGKDGDLETLSVEQIQHRIQDEAKEIIERWGKDLKTAVTTNTLIGDYPPKRLG